MKMSSRTWKLLSVVAVLIFLVSVAVPLWVHVSGMQENGKESADAEALHELPPFGKLMKKEFLMASDYVQLNHGSYGTYPKAVQKALHKYQLRAETHPDIWHRRDAKKELDKVEAMLAKLINADSEDIVIVPNTTGGINAIFRSLVFAFGERILHLNTIYGSMGSVIQYIVDSSKGAVSKVVLNVTYPMTNDELVQKLETFLDEVYDPRRPIRIALIDHITSVPAVINPIEQIIPLLKRRNILVLIDGAHAIGQVPIDIKALDPDFYVTNCHKWIYAARGTAILYVNKKHQGIIHPAHINYMYTNPATFQKEFFWIGTMDYSPYMTVLAALEFRRQAGGESAIMKYNHNLARDGGQYLANRLGTEVLQTEDQIGSMVDVLLPIDDPNDAKLEFERLVDLQLYKYPKTFAPMYKQNGKWWIRLSAQIYNDMSDFEVAAQHFIAICNEINSSSNITITS